MKKQTKFILIGGFLLLVLVAAGVLSTNSSLFQGSLGNVAFRRSSPKLVSPPPPPPPSPSSISISLSPTSPSGNKSVSVVDRVATYTLCAKGDAEVGKIELSFSSSEVLDPETIKSLPYEQKVLLIWTKNGRDFGTHSVISSSNSLINIVYTMNTPLKISNGSCENIDINVNTSALIAERAGTDDLLFTSLTKLYTANNAGETSSTVITSNAPVGSNILAY